MNHNITRRDILKFVGAGVVAGGVGCAQVRTGTESMLNEQKMKQPPVKTIDNWANTHDRVWLGGNYWANPMEDWRVRDGRAECINPGGNRSIHSLTHQLINPEAGFFTSVRLQNVKPNENDGGAGIRLGAKSEINEYRSNCFVQEGLDIGVVNNTLFIGNETQTLKQSIATDEVDLLVKGTPQVGAVLLQAQVKHAQSQAVLARLELLVSGDEIIGNIALVSNLRLPATRHQSDLPKHNGSRYRFSQWQIQGEAFNNQAEQKFGPILWTMYSLSDSRSDEGFVLKLSALLGPVGQKDNQTVDLQIKKNNQWETIKTAQIDPKASMVTYRIANWNEQQKTEFRVVYQEKHKDGSVTPDIYEGSIAANPVDRPLKMASLTCQNDYAFPYQPLVDNIVKLQPDLVFFSGDQLYEHHGGYGYVRAPADRATLNYLRMHYQFGWSFRDAMRHQPTLCLPDDHDVLQGNLWGEGGAAMQHIEKDPSASVLGGYIQPVDMINVVHKINTGHHPDAYDPTPAARGISSYYGEMVYGNVGFAILADRQWKSAPEQINVQVGVTGQDEAPEYINPDYDVAGLKLLGERQESFLKAWGQDWRGHKLKAVLSQTVFAGIATHQPRPDRYLKYDFDSSGWPASARNQAIEIMRDSMALHICGDTHLGTLSQYGVHQQRDSNWAFCSPAISAGWPRWWNPDSINLSYQNRPAHGLDNTGEYLDAFGNKMYVYAVANPVVGKSNNRYVKAHEKGSGFGVISFDTQALTYTMAAYKFLIDIEDNKASNLYPGWPVTIHQAENKGDNRLT